MDLLAKIRGTLYLCTPTELRFSGRRVSQASEFPSAQAHVGGVAGRYPWTSVYEELTDAVHRRPGGIGRSTTGVAARESGGTAGSVTTLPDGRTLTYDTARQLTTLVTPTGAGSATTT